MKDISEFGVTEALIALGSMVFWANVVYFGFIRRIEKREEGQDQQRVNRIGQLVSSVPDDYRKDLARVMRETQRGNADISTLVSSFPGEYQRDIAITLAEVDKIKHPYVLEQFLRNYPV